MPPHDHGLFEFPLRRLRAAAHIAQNDDASWLGYRSDAGTGKVSGEFIGVVSARQNNLKLPLGELIVVTGVSGSKATRSSLALRPRPAPLPTHDA